MILVAQNTHCPAGLVEMAHNPGCPAPDVDVGVSKGQGVRLLDVWVLGPFMVWFAVTADTMPAWARLALGVGGLATFTYNWQNYAARERAGGGCP